MQSGNDPRRANCGFTLLELLVVIVIIAFLFTIAVAAFRGVRDQSRVTECANGLRQMWAGLTMYAQDNYGFVPIGHSDPQQLPAHTAGVFREMLDDQIELLYCRTYPQRSTHLKAWQDAAAAGRPYYSPWIGYLYLAGSRYDGWDVPNDALAEDFRGARRIESVGAGAGNCADTVWMTDLARCSTSAATGRSHAENWKLTNHPPQLVTRNPGRMDFRLPDGVNVLFEDGHITFRPFRQLRPRLICRQAVFYW